MKTHHFFIDQTEVFKKNRYMKKNIKGYLHFYLGCYILIGKDTVYPVQGILKGVYCYDRKGLDLSVQVLTKYGQNLTYKIDQTTLILRPLSDMTEEEAKEVILRFYRRIGNAELKHININDSTIRYRIGTITIDRYVLFHKLNPEQTRYILSKSFDLFGLHEAGLCLYRNEKGELY